MIPDQIRLFFFYKGKKSDRFPEIKARKPNSKKLFEFSSTTRRASISKEFHLIALSLKERLNIVNIGFNSSNLIDKIAYHHDFLPFQSKAELTKAIKPLFLGITSGDFFGFLGKFQVKFSIFLFFFLFKLVEHRCKFRKISASFATLNRIFFRDKGDQASFFIANDRDSSLQNIDSTESKSFQKSGWHQAIINIFQISLHLRKRLPTKKMDLFETMSEL